MSFKPEMKVYGEPNFYQNAQAFATYDEAYASARNRFYNWTQVQEYRVAESDEPVNYVWEDGVGDVRLPLTSE